MYHIVATLDNDIVTERWLPNRWRCQAAMRYAAKKTGIRSLAMSIAFAWGL